MPGGCWCGRQRKGSARSKGRMGRSGKELPAPLLRAGLPFLVEAEQWDGMRMPMRAVERWLYWREGMQFDR